MITDRQQHRSTNKFRASRRSHDSNKARTRRASTAKTLSFCFKTALQASRPISKRCSRSAPRICSLHARAPTTLSHRSPRAYSSSSTAPRYTNSQPHPFTQPVHQAARSHRVAATRPISATALYLAGHQISLVVEVAQGGCCR